MAQVFSEKDAIAVFNKLVAKALPGVIKDSSNNIRSGTITTVNTSNRTANVVISSGQQLKDLKYPKGTTGVSVGDRCIVVSTDPFFTGSIFIVAIL